MLIKFQGKDRRQEWGEGVEGRGKLLRYQGKDEEGDEQKVKWGEEGYEGPEGGQKEGMSKDKEERGGKIGPKGGKERMRKKWEEKAEEVPP